MPPFLWLLLTLFVSLGKGDKGQQQVQHQRTRYLTLGSHYVVGNPTNTHYRSQADHNRPPQEPRPLFRWDTPKNELSAVAPMNYHDTISAVKPTIWQRRKKPYIKRKKAGDDRSRAHSVSFRKSYVYKAIPSEEIKPTPSKKVIYVVSRKNKPNRHKGVHRVKHCKNPRKCGYRHFKHGGKENIRTTNDVDYFPKGLIVDGLEELNKGRKTKAKTPDKNVTPSSGICLSAPEKCEQICTEENGEATCSCYAGFMVVNRTRCVDVNECESKNGGCDWKCINTVGSRRCICPNGYRLSTDDKCLDVNECLLRNGHGPCQDTCINTRGGYYCTCDGLKGTVLAPDNHTCKEVNDCDTGKTGCSHTCISTFGRSFCTCPDGYELGEDWKTCHDIDECAEFQDQNNGCEHGCVNTAGSYYCEMGNTLTRG